MRFRTFARLVRLPNVFTVIGDILMGFLFVHPRGFFILPFACLLVASISLYWAGMVFNDVFDLEQDQQQRPHRPIPSGEVSLAGATRLGVGLLLLGMLAGTAAGYSAPNSLATPWKSGLVALVLASLIVAYDAGGKRIGIGPLLMGGCRTANILLGMSTGRVVRDYAIGATGYDAAEWAVAGGLGIYVAGVTWFARREAGEPRRGEMLWGATVMVAGLTLLASFPFFSVCQAGRYHMRMPHDVWPLVLLVLAIPILRRVVIAIHSPTPERIGGTVKTCILSLIVLDAAVCLQVSSQMIGSVVILSLLLPTLFLGRFFYST